MARGNAEYVEMKGFMGDFVVKGGADDESSGSDVAEDEKLHNKANGKTPPKGKHSMNEDDLTIDPEVKLVEDAAKRDIESGYVSDVQGERVGKKGFEAFNEMCTKGVAVDIDINPHNVGEAMGQIASHTGMVCKEINGETTIGKGALGTGLRRIGDRAGLAGATMAGNLGKRVDAAKEAVGAVASNAKQKFGEGVDLVGSKARKARTLTRAEIRKNPLRSVGVGAAGGAALGVGADEGVRKATDKCSGAPMKMKGIETKGVVSGAKKLASRAGFGAAAATGNLRKAAGDTVRAAGRGIDQFADKHPKKAIAAAMGAGALAGGAIGTGINAAAGAAGAGPGKRLEGAKEGVRATGRSLIHPLEATDPANADKYNPYVAGKKLREKD